MATSNRYTIPSKNFFVDQGESEGGRWLATVAYRVKDGRGWVDLAKVTLREMPKGTIELDVGSREEGGRARTGTHDRQKAVNQAVKQVEKMGKAAARDAQLTRKIHAGESEITMMGGYKLWLDAKLEERERDPETAVTDATLRHVEQACEIAVNMRGRDFRLAELAGWMDEFGADLLKYRQDGFTFDPRLVEKLDLNSSGTRKPAHRNTAVKDLRRVCEVIDLVASRVDPKNPERCLLHPNPVGTNGYTPPREDNRGQGKTPISWETQAMLLSPLKRGHAIEPSPLDQADDDGCTRLAAVLMGHQGMRRESPLILQRKHIATSPEEIRAMHAAHGRYLRREDLAEYEDRFWILHDDTKMKYRDPIHYVRPVPCNRIVEAEVRRFFDMHDLWDADPGAYLMADPDSDRLQPYSTSTLYHASVYEKAVDSSGEEIRGHDGHPVVKIGEDGLPVIKKLGGRFEKAFNILRAYLHERGDDWQRYLPANFGEGVHGYRSNLEEAVVKKQWIQIADIKALQDEYDKVNLARYADYLLNRKMAESDRNERYALLEPVLLLAIVDHENGPKAAAKLAQQAEEEETEFMDQMAKVAGL